MVWRSVGLLSAWRGSCWYNVAMHATGHRLDWLLSCALFAAILLALVIAALLLDPLGASIP